MNKKIFDDRGFLSKEGKAFINDGFLKEVKRVMGTAQNINDISVIGSILKSIVGDVALEHINAFNPPPTKTDNVCKIIPFPNKTSSVN